MEKCLSVNFWNTMKSLARISIPCQLLCDDWSVKGISYGTTYQYHALITEQDYAKKNIFQMVDDYIEDSYKGLVSTFLKEEKLSVDELRDLLAQVETYKESKQ